MILIPDSVFPSDSQGRAVCPRCREIISKCSCPSGTPAADSLSQKFKPVVRPKIRLDKSGRKGKIVTLIYGLPANEAYLKELAKTLKIKTGSGGTFYISENAGVIEIQGDHCSAIARFIDGK